MELCMKLIIVPTDFSPAALSAVNYAADLALSIDASLLLLHVYQVPVAVTETATVMIPAEELEENAERQLAELSGNLRHITSGKLRLSTEARLGDVAEELEACSQTHQPLLLVMGTTGHSALERTLFGSTTLSVIRHSSHPVLVVPKGKEFGNGIRKSVLAWDLSKDFGPVPADAIADLLKLAQSSLSVVHVSDKETSAGNVENVVVSSPLSGTISADPVTSPAGEELVKSAFPSLDLSIHHVIHDDVGEGIHLFATDNNADMVITIPQRHGFLESLFSRGSTEGLIRHTSIPVLCCPAR